MDASRLADLQERLLSNGPYNYTKPEEIDLIGAYRRMGYCRYDDHREGSHMITDARVFPALRRQVILTEFGRQSLEELVRLKTGA